MNVPEGANAMKRLVDWATKLNPDIPLEGLEHSSLAQCQEKQRVHELAAANGIEVWLVGHLPLMACAQGIERQISQMLRIVVVTGDESVEASSEPVDGAFEGGVIFIGEDDVELAVEQGGGEIAEASGYESQADEIALGALRGRYEELAGCPGRIVRIPGEGCDDARTRRLT